MFNAKKQEDTGLQTIIDLHIESMRDEDKGSVEYARKVDQLQKLYSLKEDTSKSKVSADTLAIVAGNLAGILLIVGAEKTGVVTSKALQFLLKTR